MIAVFPAPGVPVMMNLRMWSLKSYFFRRAGQFSTTVKGCTPPRWATDTSHRLPSGAITPDIGAIFNEISFVPDNSWTETGINWNNRPGADAAFDTYVSSANAPLNFDVTSLVRAAQSGDKNNI